MPNIIIFPLHFKYSIVCLYSVACNVALGPIVCVLLFLHVFCVFYGPSARNKTNNDDDYYNYCAALGSLAVRRAGKNLGF